MNIPAFQRYWPLGDVFLRFLEIGFFDKLFGLEKSRLIRFDALRRRQDIADADIAITGGRFRWFDSDSDNDLSARRQIKRVSENLLKFPLLRNHVVGRKHRHDSVDGALSDDCRAEGDGGAGVPPHWLGNDVFRGQLWQLAADFGRLDGIGDDKNIFQRNRGRTRSTACCSNDRGPARRPVAWVFFPG